MRILVSKLLTFKNVHISLSALKFSGVHQKQSILLQEVEDISSKFPVFYETCCKQREQLQGNKISLDCIQWTTMQVRLYMNVLNQNHHLIGETQVQNSGMFYISISVFKVLLKTFGIL